MSAYTNSQILNAAVWSSASEIAAKIISPITNMILARIIAPEAFGIVATVTMIVSFADMFTDSGFQKYLVQHEFKDDVEKYNYTNVAFWTNYGISIFLWCIICLFNKQMAELVGNPGLGHVIAAACLQLPLTSFSSIQTALYRRDFDFKTLFVVRLISVCIPIIVTVPLALWGLSYWSLIIGTLFIRLISAVILTVKSKWKPEFYYSFRVLKEMLSFSAWSLIEAISIWLSVWADTFVIAYALNQYYLGLYKTSVSMVNTLMSLITSSMVPVLFAALSRLQDDDGKFKKMFYKFQRLLAVFILPLGVGIYLYRDFATMILLGDQWREASELIGIWAFTRSVKIVLGDCSSEVYRAKGRPKLSFVAQILHIIVLIPACIISSGFGFWPLVYTRSWVQVQFIIVHLLLMKIILGFPILKIFKNIFPAALSSAIMGLFCCFLQHLYEGTAWDIISVFVGITIYFMVLLLFPAMKKEMFDMIRKVSSEEV